VKVAIDISPTTSGHSTRGIGVYTKNLLSELQKINDIKIIPFENSKKPPKADLIHYPYFDMFFHTLPILCDTPRVVTLHDVIPLVFPENFDSGKKGKINLWLQKIALKNTQGIITDSNASKIDIINRLSYPQEKIHVVYLAAGQYFKQITNSKKLGSIKEKYQLPHEYLLYVGDVNWNKNLPNLLKSIKLTRRNLVFVGKAFLDENLLPVKEINSLIKNLKIEKLVSKLGFIEDDELASVYNLAEVTIVPSLYEGFGLPVVESMACGTPVICSSTSSLTEIGGDAAIYCSANNPEDIAAKINNFMSLNENSKREIKEMSLRQALKFSWKRTAEEVFRAYKTISV
jgi:glycosyltransferase involved in cell wall biosynthesis